jgi:hypothetical protein
MIFLLEMQNTDCKLSLYPEYQNGRAIPSADREIYVAWNQLVGGVLED